MRARPRYGDDKDRRAPPLRRAGGRRPTSPPTSPTCATSSSAASTARSTCSAPTTTAYVARSEGVARDARLRPATRVEVLLYQLVHLTRGGEQTKMSKRKRRRRLPRRLHRRGRRRRGALVPRQPRPRPDDRDRRRPRRREVAEEPRLLRPVRARARSPASSATRGDAEVGGRPAGARSRREERELVKRLAEFPGVVARGDRAARPAAVPTYAIRLADDFHRFYHEHRVLESSAEAFRLGSAARRSG